MTTAILRYTDDALHTLRAYAAEHPDAWANSETDLDAVLHRLGITEPTETTGITAHSPITMPPVTDSHRPHGDRTALQFYDNLGGLQPQNLHDFNMMAWLACAHLRDFAQTRWPRQNDTLSQGWISRRFLGEGADERRLWNVAGRTLWLAYTARRAAAASGNAFTEDDALEWFCAHPEHYHTAIGYEILSNDICLAEYVYAMRQGANKYDGRGRLLAGELNRRAGAVIIDALPRQSIRDLLAGKAQALEAKSGHRHVNVLSLGAGVQSTAMALMMEQGHRGLIKPDFAIFADTGWEPQAVYDHLEWLKTKVSYEIITVRNGNIKDSVLTGVNPEGRKFLDMPVYVVKQDGKTYIGTRQCTKQYKLKPIYRYLREDILKVPAGKPVRDVTVHMMLGISTDESSRQKPARETWISNEYPLLDKRISRHQLIQWLVENYPDHHVPKSACIGCPYHSDATWATMKAEDPDSWNDAVGIDWALRNLPQASGTIDGTAYLHRSRKPLTEVDFGDAKAVADQQFQDECEGLCGI